jgi:hypothetical protein
MPIENIIILLAAWLSSLGLLGVIMLGCAQADAAQEKLASEWALNRRERQHLGTAAWSA